MDFKPETTGVGKGRENYKDLISRLSLYFADLFLLEISTDTMLPIEKISIFLSFSYIFVPGNKRSDTGHGDFQILECGRVGTPDVAFATGPKSSAGNNRHILLLK